MKKRNFKEHRKPVVVCVALACTQLFTVAPLRADTSKDRVSQSSSIEDAPNKTSGSEPESISSSNPTDGGGGSIDGVTTTQPAKAMPGGVASPMALGVIAAGLGVAVAAGGGGGGGGGGKSYSYFDSASGAYLTEYNAQSGLPLINARSLNDYNYTGNGIRLAIVDTGIDAAHQEFAGRTINGTDFAGTAGGATTDLDGHGTHVASIATGTRDGVGMRGVAYDATIYSYKIGDDAGTLVGVNTDAKWASVIDRHVTDSVKISNNSWGANTAITSYTEAQLRASYPLTISALQTAVANGTIFVWAAMNSGLTEVSPEAGLPYRITGIEDGWLAVVAVDSSGNETAYTNRCGVASNWCVTAPGGGDVQATDGIYAAQSGGTYVRMSGTSMAAPHVSGLLAALAEKFPELTSAQLVTRVKTTASLTGLTSVGGCTTSTCTDAQMRAIFGHGLVNGTAAMARIGSYVYPKALNVLTGETINLSSQKLLIPTGLSETGKKLFLDRKFKVFDSFDGAVFEVSGAEIFNPHRASTPAVGYMPATNSEPLTDGRPKLGIIADHASQYGERLTMSWSDRILGSDGAAFWGTKLGLMPGLTGQSGSKYQTVEYMTAPYGSFSFVSHATLSNDSKASNFGIGFNWNLTSKTSILMTLGSAQVAGTFGLSGGLGAPKTLKSNPLKMGLKHQFFNELEIFGQLQRRSLEESDATTQSWGAKNIVYQSAIMGLEYSNASSRFSIGVIQPEQIKSGAFSLISPDGRQRDGTVLWKSSSVSYSDKPKFAGFAAAKFQLNKSGSSELIFSLQQDPDRDSKIERASIFLVSSF